MRTHSPAAVCLNACRIEDAAGTAVMQACGPYSGGRWYATWKCMAIGKLVKIICWVPQVKKTVFKTISEKRCTTWRSYFAVCEQALIIVYRGTERISC